jgi:hypothetical protein
MFYRVSAGELVHALCQKTVAERVRARRDGQ